MRLVRPGQGRTGRGGRIRLVIGIVIVAAVAVLGWAWADGGREPLREIVQPVAVPEQAR